MRALVIALLTVALSGCFGSTDGADEPDVPVATPAPRAPGGVGPAVIADDAPLASYFHDLSTRVAGIQTVTEQYRTAVPGLVGEPGVELDTWVIRPVTQDPVPVVLEVTPYYGGGEPTGRGRVGHELIERGYAVGVSSVRGTGNSGGCFSQGGPQEAVDTAAVIEHLAAEPWSNGNVGLIGVSYPGTTPQDVWVEAPPSLKTIVPISGISDMYRYNFVHGVHINPQGPAFNTYYWVLVGPYPLNTDDAATVPGAVAGEVCPDQVFVQEGGISSGVDGNKDDYWQVRDFGAEYLADTRDVQRASVFFIHGLQDWNVKPHMMEGWLDLLWGSGAPLKVWLGQWGHAWPASTGIDNHCETEDPLRGPACREDWWNLTLVAWFDQFLKGIDTGIMDGPAVQVQDDTGRWRHEARWPPEDTQTLTFHLASGQLSPAPGTPADPSYAIAPNGLAVAPPTGGATSLTYVSDPLPTDVTVSGMPRFIGDVLPSGNRANLIISLGERTPTGDRYVNFGVLSLNHNAGLEEGVASVAGQTLGVDLPFFPQDDVFHAGNRIILTFAGNTAGGPGPSLLPANDLGTITILESSEAKLELPVDLSLVYEDPQPYLFTPPDTQVM